MKFRKKFEATDLKPANENFYFVINKKCCYIFIYGNPPPPRHGPFFTSFKNRQKLLEFWLTIEMHF